MRHRRIWLAALLAASACRPAAEIPQNGVSAEAAKPTVPFAWTEAEDPQGPALVLTGRDRSPVIRLVCAGGGKLVINVPEFRPIGSEERLSFGAGGEVVALVADPSGDKARGGVSGEGPIPNELKRLLIAPLSATYGAQVSGPHPPPPDALAGPFLQSCSESLTEARRDESKPTPGTHPCLVQDGVVLRLAGMRAIGTEPFWGARTEGRCVTYSTPDDQQGTRIWTKVESGPAGPIWVGSFQGKPFVLRIEPAVRCSDGMSDKRYDWAAALTVAGEERKGCAERL